ncbi:hypothetical protein NK214_18530 [Chromobacterium sp. S0633]|uniref:hypothetical protein n=1 Tax=Chromobacterium sp. S0633 TaxID=2957805 RepID=UPI00209D3F71|nr:hypothetical protein [Chromobacterium sp. S0633]MCP1292182.1 hypothetical protein [Chromobacterium sp. S0633]
MNMQMLRWIFWLLIAIAFSIPSYSFAFNDGSELYLSSRSELAFNNCRTAQSLCQFEAGQKIRLELEYRPDCQGSQPGSMNLYLDRGSGYEEVSRLWGGLVPSNFGFLAGYVTTLLKAAVKPEAIDYFKTLHPFSISKEGDDSVRIKFIEPGKYMVELITNREEGFPGWTCPSFVNKYYFEIKKPSHSALRLIVAQPNAVFPLTSEKVKVDYGNREWVTITVDAYENDKELNARNIDSCEIDAKTNSEKTNKEKKGEYFVHLSGSKTATIHPEFLERGRSVTLSGTCTYQASNGYRETVPIESRTLERKQPDYGSPRMQWGDDSNASKQFDWAGGAGGAAKSLRIKVVSTQPNQKNLSWDYCQITGTGSQSYSFSERITTETKNSLGVERLGKGQTAPGGAGKEGNATFSGTCYEDEAHWDYYSQPLNSITLQRLAPRIITQNSVNQGDVNGALANSPREVHPDGVFSVDARASLTNFYPGIKFVVALSDNSLAAITDCGKISMKSNNICLLGMPEDKVTVQAASKDKIKVKKQLTVKMNVESQDLNDVSDVFTFASTQIEIVPQITVRGRSTVLDVKMGDHSVNAQNIVLHQGRELEVTLSNYRLIGDMPGGGENGQTSGELKALTLALPPELDKTARPKWAIAATALTDADAAWTGHDTATKLNSQAAKYSEDQPLKVTVPIKVIGDAAKKVKLKISGQYGTPQAEVLNPLGSNETMVTIDIGDKLLPADKVFSMNVNQTEALQLSHNPPNNLNYVEVHFKAAKDVSGVDLRVDLPEGLQRGVHGELQLLKNNVIFKSENCPNSCLVNEWRKSGAVVGSLSMSKDDAFNLKIPVELAASAPDTLHPIAITIEQNDERVDQDTKERVVEWKTANSMLEMRKPVIVKSREQVDVHEMDPALQVADENGKTFRAVVDVMNADATDKVILKGGNREWEMNAVAVDHASSNQKRYEATDVPMLKKLSDTLTVVVKPGNGDPVLKRVVTEADVNRALTCRTAESDCTLIWRGARVPYFHSAKDNALEFNLSNLGKETWFDKLYQLSVRADPWAPVSLFLPKKYTLPLLDEDSGKKTQSFMLDGTLPQEGDFHFDYVHE